MHLPWQGNSSTVAQQGKKYEEGKMLRMCRVEINYLNKPKKYFFTALMKLGNLIDLLEDLRLPRLLQKRAIREETTNTFLSC